jgi:hypothetical protein
MSVNGEAREARYVEAGPAKAFTGLVFITASVRGFGRMVKQAQFTRGSRSGRCRPVAESNNGVHGL